MNYTYNTGEVVQLGDRVYYEDKPGEVREVDEIEGVVVLVSYPQSAARVLLPTTEDEDGLMFLARRGEES